MYLLNFLSYIIHCFVKLTIYTNLGVKYGHCFLWFLTGPALLNWNWFQLSAHTYTHRDDSAFVHSVNTEVGSEYANANAKCHPKHAREEQEVGLGGGGQGEVGEDC